MEKYTNEEIRILLKDVKKFDELDEKNLEQILESFKNKDIRNIVKNNIENRNEELLGKDFIL